MKRHLLTACALAVLAGCATAASEPAAVAPAPVAEAPPPAGPTAAEAAAFIADAEAKLTKMSEYVARISWIRNTYITYDTMALEAQANAEFTEMGVKLAKGAARFNDTPGISPDVRRKLNLLKLGLVLPAPDRPGAADELAQIGTRMDSTYATGKFTFKGKQITLDDASELMASSRNPADLKALYEGWRTISAKGMNRDYARMVEIANEGSRDLGYADTGALWRAGYDMSPDEFAAETDRLWNQVQPFYENLHCYVRARLNDKYGNSVQPRTGPIRADLLGNMWSQDWSNIYDVVAPRTGVRSSYNLDTLLTRRKYDAERMVRTGESFYVSLGLPALPASFWERSMITRPRDREVVCHASAWDVDNLDDLRIKMCTKVNGEDFYTVHHELGHNYYQRAYNQQPFLFRNGANDGFHEAIGDFVGLSATTPTYLNQIGLLDRVPAGTSEDIPFLLKMGLQKIAFLPFALVVDRWRWGVFAGDTTPAEYNQDWTALMLRYQGLVPPGPRPADAFDPGAKYHVPGNVPYTRYFLAHIYQFQFHRAACRMAGWTGPLHRCSVYGNKEVGARFNAMMQMGQSRPWPEALEAFTGERQTDGTAVTAYFGELNAWLTQQNRGETCGW